MFFFIPAGSIWLLFSNSTCHRIKAANIFLIRKGLTVCTYINVCIGSQAFSLWYKRLKNVILITEVKYINVAEEKSIYAYHYHLYHNIIYI